MRVVFGWSWLFALAISLGITPAMGLYGPKACAATIVIDSFALPVAEGDFYSFDPTGFPALVPAQPEPILGVFRDLTVTVVGPIDWKSVSGTIGSAAEVLSVATWGDSGSKVLLDYYGLPQAGLIDDTHNTVEFAFNFLEAGDLNMRITVTGDGGTAVFDSATSSFGDIPQSSTPFIYAIPFDEFVVSGGDAPGNIDSISIVLNDPAGGPITNLDFELTSIMVLPEPSTLSMLAALGVVLAFVLCRRRR